MIQYCNKLYWKFQACRRERYIRSLVSRGLLLGENVDIIADFFFDPSHCFLISIGNNCTICPNVRLIAHDASTKKLLGFTKIGKITIGDNCFIGDSVIILPDVIVGAGSIIGSGAIVTSNIGERSVATGCPAKVICTITEYEDKMKKLFTNNVFDEEFLIDNITESKREEILGKLENGIGFIV